MRNNSIRIMTWESGFNESIKRKAVLRIKTDSI